MDICNIQIEDDVHFSFNKITEIRAGDEYSGYRISLTANYQKDFEYATDIEFNDTLKALEENMGLISGHV